MTPSVPIRVLTNIRLPEPEGYILRTFGDYLPPGRGSGGSDPAGSAPAWRPENERRALVDILPLIPAAEKPDILVISTPEYLPIPVDVADFPGIRILLITDWNVCLRFLPDLCPLFDYCFTDWPGYHLLSKAGVANVRHQPLFGHDPSAFLHQGKTRNLDVSFCGNLNVGLHRERNRLLARLAKWGAASGRPLHLGQAFNNDYVDVLNRSRLVFNYSIRGEANMRLFEAMACGAVPLIEASNQEAAILFQEGRHYFRYDPDRLEVTLDGLLADPARIQAASVAAREAVAGHTKAAQIRSLLDAAVREHGAGAGSTPPRSVGSPRSARPVDSTGSDWSSRSAQSPQSVKALVKLRVLGAAYTLPEALQELQARAADLPGLDAETLPGMLLSLLEANPGGSLAAARHILERLLDAGGRPASVRDFLRMRLAAADGNWEEARAAARRCRLALSGAAGLVTEAEGPDAWESVYRHFLAPVELGKGLNTDLNRAYRADRDQAFLPAASAASLPAGSAASPPAAFLPSGMRPQGPRPGYPALLLAHCLAMEARAALAHGLPDEALRIAGEIPKADFVSVDPFELMAEACAAAGDGPRLRAILLAWYAEKPLDTGVWTKVAEGLDRLGNKPELIAFLEDILVLADHFLPPAHVEMVRTMLARQHA